MAEKKKVSTCADLDLEQPTTEYGFWAAGDSLIWNFPITHSAVHNRAVELRVDSKTDEYYLSIRPPRNGRL